MRRFSQLEQEYKNLKHQEAPDLWSRIEEHLEEHPEPSLSRERKEKEDGKVARHYKGWGILPSGLVFGAAASIAAVFLLVAAGPWYDGLLSLGRREKTFTEGLEMLGGEAGMAAETTAFAQETYVEEGETVRENSLASGETAGQERDFGALKPSAFAEGNLPSGEGKKAGTAPGVLLYSQLDLADYRSLSLPAQAVTLSDDAMYFSEEILEDTELLCLGTVTSVSLESDHWGRPALLVYEIQVDSVCYSDNYTTGLTHIQVKSPIVAAVGGDHQILYQLQDGASYVLPLKTMEGGWELLFPFAPQIQVTPGGGYLFHSGYASLADDSAFVVVGQREGDNDFYYDRMLLRDDDHFLSDLVSLVMNQSLNGGKL